MVVLKTFLNALGCTVACYVLTLFLYSVVSWHYSNMSVNQSDTWILICLGVVLLFAIFLCTFTILHRISALSASDLK
jgi:drug/metabolite transporter (DMT)-like permease